MQISFKQALKASFLVSFAVGLSLASGALAAADPALVEKFAREIGQNTKATYFMEYLEDDGAIALAEVLKNNNTLISLELEWNDIGDIGAAALAAALKGNQTLRKLDLARNKITDAGISSFAELLKSKKNLDKLEVFGNPFGEKGAKALIDAMQFNYSLTKAIDFLPNTNSDMAQNTWALLRELCDRNNKIAEKKRELWDNFKSVASHLLPKYGLDKNDELLPELKSMILKDLIALHVKDKS